MIEYISLADTEGMKRFEYSFTLSGKITQDVCAKIVEMCQEIDGAAVRLPPFMKYVNEVGFKNDLQYLQIMTDDESVSTMFALRFPEMFAVV